MRANFGNRVVPCLLVADMRETLDFYVKILGFTQTGYYSIESEPVRTEVRRDGVAIYLFSDAKHIPDQCPTFSGAIYIFLPGRRG